MNSTLVILSGGLDSTVMLYLAAAEGGVEAISFDYGQRHSKELGFAADTCAHLGVKHHLVPMDWFGSLVAGRSALVTETVEIPLEGYDPESMNSTVVPNRNAVMVSVAAAVAEARGIRLLALGVHGGDHHLYPDCRPVFLESLGETVTLGTDGKVALWAPFRFADKAAIVSQGDALDVPWTRTWSCYVGGDLHCGRCGTCRERREAFSLAGVVDPTEYER